jgi:uncharacterized protein YjbI with pentapeptide repeats
MNMQPLYKTQKRPHSALLAALGLVTLIAAPSTASAVGSSLDRERAWVGGNQVGGPKDPDSIKAKERKLEEVIAGTIMRSGVVFPKHKPLPQIEQAREFLRQGRPATTAAEVAELIKSLQEGDPKALANFEKHMAKYISKLNGNRSAELIGALNEVIDNPNAYKLRQGYAQNLLDKAFDQFIAMDYHTKNDLDFSRTNLEGKFIAGLDLRKTKLGTDQLHTFTDWAKTDVSGLDLTGMDFTNKNTTGTIFKSANLENSNWNGKNMTRNNLWGANLSGAQLQGADLSRNSTAKKANFSGANLTGATAHRGTFEGGSFQGAILTNADFSNSKLRGANLSGAETTGTNFTGAEFGDLPSCN